MRWLILRVLLISAAILAGTSATLGDHQLPVWAAFVGVGAGLLTLVAWVRPLYPRFVSTVTWLPPSWTSSPFNIRRPLDAFHLGGYLAISVSVGMLASALKSAAPLDGNVLMPAGFGVGLLLGVALVAAFAGSKRTSHGA